MFVHVFFMFPETAGKPLEEVTAILEGRHGNKYIGTPAWKTRNGYSESRKREQGDLAADNYVAPHKNVSMTQSGKSSSPERLVVGNLKV